METLQVSIPNHFIAQNPQNKNKKFVVYNVECQLLDRRWFSQKRYNEFYDLHQSLSEKFGQDYVINSNFPKKIIFGNLSNETIETRKFMLSEYLKYITKNYWNNEIMTFLEAPIQKVKEEENQYVKAIYPYQATSSEELTFAEGDVLHVYARDEKSGWFYGYKKGKESIFGFIPSNFTDNPFLNDEPSEDSDDDSEKLVRKDVENLRLSAEGQKQKMKVPPIPPKKIKKAEVLFNYNQIEDVELTVKKGDIVEVLQPDLAGWTYCKNIRTQETGYLPSSYIQILLQL